MTFYTAPSSRKHNFIFLLCKCFCSLNVFRLFTCWNNDMICVQGLVPAAIRLIPHTVLTFIFLEQLKQRFGAVVVTWGWLVFTISVLLCVGQLHHGCNSYKASLPGVDFIPLMTRTKRKSHTSVCLKIHFHAWTFFCLSHSITNTDYLNYQVVFRYNVKTVHCCRLLPETLYKLRKEGLNLLTQGLLFPLGVTL